MALREGDVGSPTHGIAEESERNVGFKVAHLYFRLHRRVALHAADSDEVHQIGGEFGEFGDCALYEESAFRGVETCRKVVERHLDDVLTYLL